MRAVEKPFIRKRKQARDLSLSSGFRIFTPQMKQQQQAHPSIIDAQKSMAPQIADLIMQAMNEDCCRFFAGPQHTLDDFRTLMIHLVEQEGNQYSYQNAQVAVDADGQVMGSCVSYDGARLHTLRRAFITGARQAFDRDFSDMADETQSGELYIDSLAVKESFRHRGIATALLRSALEKARRLHLPAVGLLVDTGNPAAEHLYVSLGFRYVGEASWGSHPMKHLQFFLK
jgi:ribosomal protein S18 acetylase RimI-like enzyme